MKLIFLSLMVFKHFTLFSQSSSEIKKASSGIRFAKNTIYLVCRATRQKAGIVAQRYNILDSNITHVGIGFLDDAWFQIYNVIDNATSFSSLSIDSLESFLSCGNVSYLSVWSANTSVKEFNQVVAACIGVSGKKIYFDASFIIAPDDTLYCSEFCSRILSTACPDKFNFIPTRRMLNNKLFELFLGRKELIYFPVDFFEANPLFQKIYEYRFKSEAPVPADTIMETR